MPGVTACGLPWHPPRTAWRPFKDYLGRPDVGPVAYGSDDAPDVTLYVDTPDPDPGDLRIDRRA